MNKVKECLTITSTPTGYKSGAISDQAFHASGYVFRQPHALLQMIRLPDDVIYKLLRFLADSRAVYPRAKDAAIAAENTSYFRLQKRINCFKLLVDESFNFQGKRI